MPPRVEITAPSRLHFGLFSFGETAGRRFGGVGAMIAKPVLRLCATPAREFSVGGKHSQRVLAFARKCAKSFGLQEPPACRLEVVESPNEHHGLGLGTQLGMSVATALAGLAERNDLSPDRLAAAVGRGTRSAVGVHGFSAGGLIVDGGKLAGEPLGSFERRVALPSDWRFVLAPPQADIGLAGAAEIDAFSRLPPPSMETTERLRDLALNELAPAAEVADFERFSAALYAFNVAAGECFAAVQGGPFASRAIADVVTRLQSLGCVGCGQSSWGPTVFGLANNQTAAERIADHLHDYGVHASVAAPNNTGAEVKEAARI